MGLAERPPHPVSALGAESGLSPVGRGEGRTGCAAAGFVRAGLVAAVQIFMRRSRDVYARGFAAPKRLRPRRPDGPGHDGGWEQQTGLFRPHRRVAAGAAGGRDHGGGAGVGGRGVHVGVDAGGRAEHAVGLGEPVAERFPRLAGGGAAVGGGGQPVRGRAAAALRRVRRGLLRRRSRGGRGLRDRAAGGGDQGGGEDEVWGAHGRETRGGRGVFPGGGRDVMKGNDGGAARVMAERLARYRWWREPSPQPSPAGGRGSAAPLWLAARRNRDHALT